MGAILVPMVIDYYAHPGRVIAGWMLWGDLTLYSAQQGWIYAQLNSN